MVCLQGAADRAGRVPGGGEEAGGGGDGLADGAQQDQHHQGHGAGGRRRHTGTIASCCYETFRNQLCKSSLFNLLTFIV